MDDWTLTNWIREISDAEAKLIGDVTTLKNEMAQLQTQLSQLEQTINNLKTTNTTGEGDKHE